MEDVVKGVFAAAMVGERLPGKCPAHVVEFYDLLSKYWLRLLSNAEPPHTERAWIAALADSLHQRDERIARLEQRIASLETAKPTLSYVADDDEDDPTGEKIDKRTKEYRARKAALVEV
jgi:hypothetical protein